MTEIAEQNEATTEDLSLPSGAHKVLGGVMIIGAITGGLIANYYAAQGERQDNRDDLARASQYQSCINFIQEQQPAGESAVTTWVLDMTEDQQNNCGVSVAPGGRGGAAEGDDAVQDIGGTIKKFDMYVTLPTIDEYEQAIDDAYDSSKYSHLDVALETAPGIPGGAMVGFVGLAAALGYRDRRQRRQAKNQPK